MDVVHKLYLHCELLEQLCDLLELFHIICVCGCFCSNWFWIFVTNLHFICVWLSAFSSFGRDRPVAILNFRYFNQFLLWISKIFTFFSQILDFFIYSISWIFFIYGQYIKYLAKKLQRILKRNSIKWSKSFLAQFVVALHFFSVCFILISSSSTAFYAAPLQSACILSFCLL